MDDPLIGTLIGQRYRLTDVAGRGGMGIVYRAEDTRLSGRPCAVKLVLGTSNDPEEDKRFERELDIIARLRSRHVVQVIDAGGMPDGRRYIVMELLEGHTLQTVLRTGGAMKVEQALPLCKGILAGLAAAHEAGVIHRDLKPANIFVSETRAGDRVAKILDFGIAKETHQNAEELTGRSMLIGTPKYMAPEQFRQQPADERTDLYAAGLVFYAMLAGRAPFSSKTAVPDDIANMPPEFRIGWQHINKAPDPLENGGALGPIIERMLAKKPADRFPNADAVLTALGEATTRPPTRRAPAPMITGELSAAEAEPSSVTDLPVLGEAIELRAHRSRRPIAGLAIATTVILLGLGGWWFSRPTATTEVADAGVAEAMCEHPIQSDPPGATVIIDGTNRGVTPYVVRTPCREAVRVRIQKDGYVPAIRIAALGVGEIAVKLDARAVPLAAVPDVLEVEPVEPTAPAPIEPAEPEAAPAEPTPAAPATARAPSRPATAARNPGRTVKRPIRTPRRPKPAAEDAPNAEDAPPPAAASPKPAAPTPAAPKPTPTAEPKDDASGSPLFF